MLLKLRDWWRYKILRLPKDPEEPQPIRLFLWLEDDRPCGEFIIPPNGAERPTTILLGWPVGLIRFRQDPRNADMYREVPV